MANELVPAIVVVQTAPVTHAVCREEVQNAGIVLGRDWVLFISPHSARQAIVPNTRQLLVTGTINGDVEAAEAFVREMKDLNPALKAAMFSTMEFEVTGVYDQVIKKDGFGAVACADLIVAMREFLATGN